MSTAAPVSARKMFLTVGLVSLVAYILIFSWMEQRRHKNGPWEVTFTTISNSPSIVINHPKFGLTNIAITFVAAAPPTNGPQTVIFPHGKVAPFALPYGRCVFLDTLFLPGTVTCEMFGHQIQLLPRTLTINQQDHPWRAGEKILLTNRPSATLSP